VLNLSHSGVENMKNPLCVDPGFLDLGESNAYLYGMYIKAEQKRKAGTNETPMYYTVCAKVTATLRVSPVSG
jgi:hypothetical protein